MGEGLFLLLLSSRLPSSLFLVSSSLLSSPSALFLRAAAWAAISLSSVALRMRCWVVVAVVDGSEGSGPQGVALAGSPPVLVLVPLLLGAWLPRRLVLLTLSSTPFSSLLSSPSVVGDSGGVGPREVVLSAWGVPPVTSIEGGVVVFPRGELLVPGKVNSSGLGASASPVLPPG